MSPPIFSQLIMIFSALTNFFASWMGITEDRKLIPKVPEGTAAFFT
ncbi:hypothetical protein [Vibrio sp. SCSIO 43136]|nr:hypothetical protein [Vibrio sp. SCSIO 43136]USD66155.1 hypothetical protein J4N39_04905 [Vibrio sp. SCSIO 43136]